MGVRVLAWQTLPAVNLIPSASLEGAGPGGGSGR